MILWYGAYSSYVHCALVFLISYFCWKINFLFVFIYFFLCNAMQYEWRDKWNIVIQIIGLKWKQNVIEYSLVRIWFLFIPMFVWTPSCFLCWVFCFFVLFFLFTSVICKSVIGKKGNFPVCGSATIEAGNTINIRSLFTSGEV